MGAQVGQWVGGGLVGEPGLTWLGWLGRLGVVGLVRSGGVPGGVGMIIGAVTAVLGACCKHELKIVNYFGGMRQSLPALPKKTAETSTEKLSESA